MNYSLSTHVKNEVQVTISKNFVYERRCSISEDALLSEDTLA